MMDSELDLERALCLFQSRQELIKKGFLEEIHPNWLL